MRTTEVNAAFEWYVVRKAAHAFPAESRGAGSEERAADMAAEELGRRHLLAKWPLSPQYMQSLSSFRRLRSSLERARVVGGWTRDGSGALGTGYERRDNNGRLPSRDNNVGGLERRSSSGIRLSKDRLGSAGGGEASRALGSDIEK